jgi:hypothetical protein
MTEKRYTPSEWAALIGKKGGKAKTAKKAAAARRNAKKPRPRRREKP